MSSDLHPSARRYSTAFLRIYDWLVLGFASTYCWRCPASTVLLPFFASHAGKTAHLDVGVGTGYYLTHSLHVLTTSHITLADMHPDTLDVATHRLVQAGFPKASIRGVVHDVFTPLPQDLQGTYDAVSLFYLLHCLPGKMSEKAPKVFAQLRGALKPEGTLYGATVLGNPLPSWWLGRQWLKLTNGHGDFDNRQDNEEDLRSALEEYFEEVEVRVVGQVALFVGKKPRVGKDI